MRNKVVYKGWIFNEPKISVATVSSEESLPIVSLGIDTFEVTVKCNDKSILKFEQNDPIRWFHRKYQMGIYYVQSIVRSSKKEYTISAFSTLGVLEQRDFYGGVYNGETAQEVILAICGNIPFSIKTNLAPIKLYGWLGIMSCRQALQQVLFAIGANLTTDSNGMLHINNLWDGLAAEIPKDRIYLDGSSVTQDPPVTSFTVVEHQYMPGSETKDLFEGATTQGQRIKFDEPCDNLIATGFQILESGANYALVSAGTGKLTGTPYIHTTLEIHKPVTIAPVPNEERVEDATLVSVVNSNAVANRMVAYYKCRELQQADVVLQRERPGQVVRLFHPFDERYVTGTISESIVSVSGILKGTVKMLTNFLPQQNDVIVVYDHQEVISEESDWIVPDGVSHIRLVILDGGQGGQAGFNGTAGTRGGEASISNPQTGTKVGTNGKGGKGGAGGEPGQAGKIRVLDMDVTPGQHIHIVPGLGGAGGSANGAEGAEGTHTIVTIDGREYSTSEGGEIPPNGYRDVTTGTTYAVKGAAGRYGTDGTDANVTAVTEEYRTTKEGWSPWTTTGPTIGNKRTELMTSYGSQQVYPSYEQEVNFVHLTGTQYTISTTSPGEGYFHALTDSYGQSPGLGPYDPGYIYTSNQSVTKCKFYTTGNQNYRDYETVSWKSKCVRQSVTMIRGTAKNGISGTTYSAPANASILGCGRDGGNGGGGGYGGAAGYVTATGTYNALDYSITSPGNPGYRGLSGTKGADGAPGGVLIFYGVSKTIKPGALLTQDLNWVLDASNKLLIS